jgi:hypothetical protein
MSFPTLIPCRPHLSEATAHATNNTCTSELPAHEQLLREKKVSVFLQWLKSASGQK